MARQCRKTLCTLGKYLGKTVTLALDIFSAIASNAVHHAQVVVASRCLALRRNSTLHTFDVFGDLLVNRFARRICSRIEAGCETIESGHTTSKLRQSAFLGTERAALLIHKGKQIVGRALLKVWARPLVIGA